LVLHWLSLGVSKIGESRGDGKNDKHKNKKKVIKGKRRKRTKKVGKDRMW